MDRWIGLISTKLKTIMELVKKTSKSVTTIIQLLLGIKVKKSTKLSKYIWGLQNNCRNYDLELYTHTQVVLENVTYV